MPPKKSIKDKLNQSQISIKPQKYDPDDERRVSAGFNSPKNAKQNVEVRDGKELIGQQTPAIRNSMGVNSPRGQEQQLSFDSGPQSLNRQQSPKASGGCFSWMFCCGSSSSKPADVQLDAKKIDQKNAEPVGNVSPSTNVEEKTDVQTKNAGGSGGASSALTQVSKEDEERKNEEYRRMMREQQQQDSDEDSDAHSEEIDWSSGLLGEPLERDKGKRCLVLDLDETLVHSSFKPVASADFIVPVEIDQVVHKVYVSKRPYCDEFLDRVARDWEVVIFTASLSKYADPLLDTLDKNRVVSHRLFRESCVLHGSAYVKDLSKLGRRLSETIIVDNSPQSYIFHPKNAIPIASWFDDPNDRQLEQLCPVLETTLKTVHDVRTILDANTKSYRWLCNQATVPE